MIARKWSAGPVRAMHAGRKADNQESCRSITEWWDRLAVIVGVFFFDRVEKLSQSRAGATILVEY